MAGDRLVQHSACCRVYRYEDFYGLPESSQLVLGSGLLQQHECVLRHKRFGLSIRLLGQYSAE